MSAKQAVCFRPNFDDGSGAIQYGYNWLADVITAAQTAGWVVTDLGSNLATNANLESIITTNNPSVIFGVGHGNERLFTGQNFDYTLWGPVGTFTDKYGSSWSIPPDNVANLQNRHVHLISCLTAPGLGKDISQQPGSYVGWKVNFTFIADSATTIYTTGFKEGAITMSVGILNGLTYQQAYAATIQKFNDWINFWLQQPDPVAPEVVKWLTWNRDGLTVLTPNFTVDNPAPGSSADISIPLIIGAVSSLAGLLYLARVITGHD